VGQSGVRIDADPLNEVGDKVIKRRDFSGKSERGIHPLQSLRIRVNCSTTDLSREGINAILRQPRLHELLMNGGE
jgi:hypothetical protein